MSDEHNNHSETTSSEHHREHFDAPSPPVFASAPAPPPHDNDNGYIVVPPTPQSSIDSGDVKANSTLQDDIAKIVEDLSNNVERPLLEGARAIIAEADSSTGGGGSIAPPVPASCVPPKPVVPATTSTTTSNAKQCSSTGCTLCPYYLLACDKISKVEVPPKVRDLLLWKCPKATGAVFGSVLVLLIALASFSLFTVLGSLLLLASTAIGAYRFYLMLVFRIKGTYDDTFDKLAATDLSLPKDKVQKLVSLLENDVNRVLNKIKSALLWDNICNSAIAFTGFYCLYCVGSWFNTLTLLILAHVSAFTLPKVYQVYKQPIDQSIEKLTTLAHQGARQIVAKVPFLQHKKKTQ